MIKYSLGHSMIKEVRKKVNPMFNNSKANVCSIWNDHQEKLHSF